MVVPPASLKITGMMFREACQPVAYLCDSGAMLPAQVNQARSKETVAT